MHASTNLCIQTAPWEMSMARLLWPTNAQRAMWFCTDLEVLLFFFYQMCGSRTKSPGCEYMCVCRWMIILCRGSTDLYSFRLQRIQLWGLTHSDFLLSVDDAPLSLNTSPSVALHCWYFWMCHLLKLGNFHVMLESSICVFWPSKFYFYFSHLPESFLTNKNDLLEKYRLFEALGVQQQWTLGQIIRQIISTENYWHHSRWCTCSKWNSDSDTSFPNMTTTMWNPKHLSSKGCKRGHCGLYEDSTISFRQCTPPETFTVIAKIQKADSLNVTSFCSFLLELCM